MQHEYGRTMAVVSVLGVGQPTANVYGGNVPALVRLRHQEPRRRQQSQQIPLHQPAPHSVQVGVISEAMQVFLHFFFPSQIQGPSAS